MDTYIPSENVLPRTRAFAFLAARARLFPNPQKNVSTGYILYPFFNFLAVLLVVGGFLQCPQVRLHRLVGRLSVEGRIVGDHLSRVFHTGSDSSRDGLEAQLASQVFSGEGCRAGYGTQSAQIDAGASGVGGRSGTVGTEHHLLVSRVGRLLVDFYEGSANGFDSIRPFYFCHSRSAIGSQGARMLLIKKHAAPHSCFFVLSRKGTIISQSEKERF